MVFNNLSEDLPESLRIKILKKWMSEGRKTSESLKQSSLDLVDIEKIIYSKLVDERAVELLNKVKTMHPEKYSYVLRTLYELVSRNIINELDGYTLFIILNKYLNIPVKPDIRIKFVKRGKEVDFKEYIEK